MMASNISTGSPKLTKKPSNHFTVFDQNADPRSRMSGPSPHSLNDNLHPLQTSKLGNLQPKAEDKPTDNMNGNMTTPIDNILARLRANEPSSSGSRSVSNPASIQSFAHPNGHNITLKRQKSDIIQRTSAETFVKPEPKESSASDVATPGSLGFDFGSLEITSSKDHIPRIDSAEMLRVKQELAAAKSVINRQERELAETRTIQHTMDQAMDPVVESGFGNHHEMSDAAISHLQSAFNATARPFTARGGAWAYPDEARPDPSDGFPVGNYDRGRPMFNNNNGQFPVGNNFGPALFQPGSLPESGLGQSLNPPWSSGFSGQDMLGQPPMNPAQRIFSGPTIPTIPSLPLDGRFGNDGSQFGGGGGFRRTASAYTRPMGFPKLPGLMNNLPGPGPRLSPPSFSSSFGYQGRSMGGELSPTASEFSIPTVSGFGGGAWTPMTNPTAQTYVTPLEPMNYRRLLDRNVTCDWKYIVDKIVCNNDQQASIFLQQKLKVGTAEQKYEIVESIVNQAYPLMINRFGNFLVQRCFEHGTPDQVVAIADAIHGNVLSLSMDPFGCHVIQKAFDSVPENHKADMVRELLRRIPDTVIHRYACHVWQKLFELRWSGEPPQIMSKVNDALRGMWHEVALGETGSLVVQNIFENCVEEEKRPAIEEVIASIDLIAHGQFGNWCIQHLCEHAAPADKRRVIDHILANAYSYSIDQFASKVVEKCLKIGGSEFLDRYLGVITTAHPDRPRIPLIDIAGDQYGNYLIQWILMNAQYHQREQVAIHIRKHMVSLRGSKFGSRVAMLCCNPSQVTRPGPGVVVNPFGAPGQPRGWGRFR